MVFHSKRVDDSVGVIVIASVVAALIAGAGVLAKQKPRRAWVAIVATLAHAYAPFAILPIFVKATPILTAHGWRYSPEMSAALKTAVGGLTGGKTIV